MLIKYDKSQRLVIMDLEYLDSCSAIVNNAVCIPITSGLIISISLSDYKRYKNLLFEERALLIYLESIKKFNRVCSISDIKILERDSIIVVKEGIDLLDFSYDFLSFLHDNNITKYNNLSDVLKDIILIPNLGNSYINKIIDEILANELINKSEFLKFLCNEREDL